MPLQSRPAACSIRIHGGSYCDTCRHKCAMRFPRAQPASSCLPPREGGLTAPVETQTARYASAVSLRDGPASASASDGALTPAPCPALPCPPGGLSCWRAWTCRPHPAAAARQPPRPTAAMALEQVRAARPPMPCACHAHAHARARGISCGMHAASGKTATPVDITHCPAGMTATTS